MSEQVYVAVVPECDLCDLEGRTMLAFADARIPALGSWANVCARHFKLYDCALGTGCGQLLMTKEASR